MELKADPGFRVYATEELGKLRGIENAIAEAVEERMKALGRYERLREKTLGQPAAGVFPHGTVDVVGHSFSPAPSPSLRLAEEMTWDYPSSILGLTGAVTVVEASEYLEIVQGDKPVGAGHRFPVPPNTHLIVFGDEVCIRGKVAVPGKHVVIIARRLSTRTEGNEAAELNVSGAPLDQPDLPTFTAAAATGATGTIAESRMYWGEGFPGLIKHPYRSKEGHLPNDIPDIQAGAGGPGADGAPGARGTTGNPGGDIFLVCHALASSAELILDCSGGRGGTGQRGQDGGKGGPGGPGVDEVPVDWEKHTTWDFKIYYPIFRAALWGGPGGRGGEGGIGGPGGSGGQAGNCTLIVNKAIDAGSKIVCRSALGAPGLRGFGGRPGPLGDPGRDGTTTRSYGRWPTTRATQGFSGPAPRSGDERLQVLIFGNTPLPPDLTTPGARRGRFLVMHNCLASSAHDSLQGLRGIANVRHLAMELESARARYLKWDAYRFAEDPGADRVKDELRERLDFVALGLEWLPRYLPEGEPQIRDAVMQSHAHMVLCLKSGWDYFGHTRDYVPLGSPNVYLAPFVNALTALEERETTVATYRRALTEAKNLDKQRTEALKHAQDQIDDYHKTVNKLRPTLVKLVTETIPDTDEKVGRARIALEKALKGLETWVKECFGLTIENLADCLFNLAFIGDPREPHGKFTAFTTVVSQATNLINKAVNTLPTDDGQAVSRKHLLRKVETFTKGLAKLDEAWATIPASKKSDDPELVELRDKDAYRLLVEQEQLTKLLDQFLAQDKAQAATTAMDDYVEAVQERNGHLADYNTLVAEYLRIALDKRTAEAHCDEAQSLRALDAAPNLPAQAAFIEALHNRSRERCLTACYEATRAFRFWTLLPDDEFHKLFKLGATGAVDSNQLKTVKDELFQKRTDTVKSQLSSMIQPFTIEQTGSVGRGLRVVFRETEYPREFARLKRDGVVTLTVPFPTLGFERWGLQLAPALPSPAYIPGQGRNLIVVAEVNKLLVIRIFDETGQVVHNVPEPRLRPQHAERLDALKARLRDLWTQPNLPKSVQHEIIAAVAKIIDLKLGNPTTKTNPFTGLYNVRIDRVRVWVLGLKAPSNSKMCTVLVEHQGDERFRREDGTVIDLSHPSVSFRCTYNWTLADWDDENHYIKDPARALDGGVDGLLILKDEFKNSSYNPQIGPFARWELLIPDDMNDKELDLSGVHTICMEFHGRSGTLKGHTPVGHRGSTPTDPGSTPSVGVAVRTDH